MNANDQLREYTCSDNYYRHMGDFVYTDGVKALCDRFQSYWLLDIIVSYQARLKGEDFQVWKLTRDIKHSATVVCHDGNDRVLVKQEIEYTDFEPSQATLWLEGNTILLPSEH